MIDTGCIVCGSGLTYSIGNTDLVCAVCLKSFSSNVKCKNGHYVCDNCHQLGATEYIESYCKNTSQTNPAILIVEMMKNPKIKMHGPEHHFLVPAVLLACYYNHQGGHGAIGEKLSIAQKRSKNILGGFCGFCGNCGAGVGTGIFMSIITGATPMSVDEWRLSNLMTAKSLECIANNGGPRCCKRDSFSAIESALAFLESNLQVSLPATEIKCTFSAINKECKNVECRYFCGGYTELQSKDCTSV